MQEKLSSEKEGLDKRNKEGSGSETGKGYGHVGHFNGFEEHDPVSSNNQPRKGNCQ